MKKKILNLYKKHQVKVEITLFFSLLYLLVFFDEPEESLKS